MAKLYFNEKTGEVKEIGWCSSSYANKKRIELIKKGFKVVDEGSGKYFNYWIYFTYFCQKCKKYHILFKRDNEGRKDFEKIKEFIERNKFYNCEVENYYTEILSGAQTLEDVKFLQQFDELKKHITPCIFEKIKEKDVKELKEINELIKELIRITREECCIRIYEYTNKKYHYLHNYLKQKLKNKNLNKVINELKEIVKKMRKDLILKNL